MQSATSKEPSAVPIDNGNIKRRLPEQRSSTWARPEPDCRRYLGQPLGFGSRGSDQRLRAELPDGSANERRQRNAGITIWNAP